MSEDNKIIDDRGLDILFRSARTYNGWRDKDVSDVLVQAVYDLMKWGPTSANCCPARFVFVKSAEAKEKLKPHMMDGNVEKTMAAPVTVIIANDLEFYERLPDLFPHNPGMKDFYVGKEKFTQEAAMRNGSLQGAYFMLAARALGLDCGPMSGFSKKGVKEAFFPEEHVEVNFLCNLGYGDPDSLYPRGPRLEFDDACKIL
ncbi:MAG: malonic semialdehyde reductase [Rhodospirillales bacterium]|nr:malonic semialdehyde reductase [Rhodospirillales bacterium]MCB9995431.1 malonic semialdehyde reductase [Rhodospirillales bacterium]